MSPAEVARTYVSQALARGHALVGGVPTSVLAVALDRVPSAADLDEAQRAYDAMVARITTERPRA